MALNRAGSEAPPPVRKLSQSESSRWQKPGERFLARRRQPSRWRPAGRWCPEGASLALIEPPYICFIPRDPTGDLLAGELSWFRPPGAFRPATSRQGTQRVLL